MKEKLIFVKSSEELSARLGINHQVYEIKRKLADAIRQVCLQEGISQRNLAKLVPGMSQDRVSKIQRGLTGGMTIDKMIEIADALDLKAQFNVALKPKKRAACGPRASRKSLPRSGSRRMPPR